MAAVWRHLTVYLRSLSVSLDPRGWKAARWSRRRMKEWARWFTTAWWHWIITVDFSRIWLRSGRTTLRSIGGSLCCAPNVKFSDWTALSNGDVVAALQPLLHDGQQISAQDNVVIQSSAAYAGSAGGTRFRPILCFSRAAGWDVDGYGPIFVKQSATASRGPSNSTNPAGDSNLATSSTNLNKLTHLRFRANEETWSGRPFLDAIDVTLGVPALLQLFYFPLGKLNWWSCLRSWCAELLRTISCVWSSSPVTFYGLRFDEAQAAAADANLREALSLSLYRQTMANVCYKSKPNQHHPFCHSGSQDMLSSSPWKRTLSAPRKFAPLFLQPVSWHGASAVAR